MRRRHYLASAAALLAGPLAGCAHPNAVLVMNEVSDVEIADRASQDVDGHPEYGDLVAEVVENGSANASGRSPPIDTDQPVEHRGRYYRLTATETDRRETTRYSLTLDPTPQEGTPDGEAVPYEDLPEVDRDVLADLLPDDESTPDERERRVGRLYTEETARDSALVPDSQYVAVIYEGERYAFEVDERTQTESTYRYEAEEIATSASDFGAAVREEYAFELAGLSDAERDVVEAAVGEGYYEGSADDAFSSVARRFRDQSGFDTDEWGGEWLVRYEGTVYWADLQHPPSAVEG